MKTRKKAVYTMVDVKQLRDALMDKYGIRCGLWTQMFSYGFMGSAFCENNREYIIKMYDELAEFVGLAKKHGVVYYMGIDSFIKAYGENEWFNECREKYYAQRDARYESIANELGI